MACYEQAVAWGHTQACAPLSLMLFGGLFERVGIPPDRQKARDIAESGVRMGCPHSKGVLAMISFAYESEKLEMAQESADSGSIYGLLAMYLFHHRVWDRFVHSYIQALKLSAEQSFPPAQLVMGALYYHGDDALPQDAEQGLRLMKNAASQGFIHALAILKEWVPIIDVHIWDFAGQDVYTVSHIVHLSHRCMYLLLWKPYESLDATMRRVSPWLESLCMHVPNAQVLLVASHCKTNISNDEFLVLSRDVEAAVLAKVQELNEVTRLEVERLRKLLDGAQQMVQQLTHDYYEKLRSGWTQQDAQLLQRLKIHSRDVIAWAARASSSHLPLSLRTLASAAHDALLQEIVLCNRLQLLLGIRNGARPDGRNPSKLVLFCKSVDSVVGHGIAELRDWLYAHCQSMPFMGEMISLSWTAVADVLTKCGKSVLSQSDAISFVRQHLSHQRGPRMSDDKLWDVINFWSNVGRVFVYESQVVTDIGLLMDMLKPLLHHQPINMMKLPVYHNLLVQSSLKCVDAREELEFLLNHLQIHDEVLMQLLKHFSAWAVLSTHQCDSMLDFFEQCRFICRTDRLPGVILISARKRAQPYLDEAVEKVTAASMYHALYPIPLNHIGIIAHLQASVSSVNLKAVALKCNSGKDSLVLQRTASSQCACIFSAEDFFTGVQGNVRFASLCNLLGEPFSFVLRVASTDFGMFKFATACVDNLLDRCYVGARFQCWLTVNDAEACTSGSNWTVQEWVKFREPSSDSLTKVSLSDALQHNHHEHIVTGQPIARMLRPRSSVFISHSWGDGTQQFTKRLKMLLEQQTLASVWVDLDNLNQQQETIIPSIRKALCQARIVIVLLTPTYLTRPNCLRELRWALDFERAGHLRVVLLSLHPAVTFPEREKLVQDGPRRGLLFSSKERKVKRICGEAITLVKRLNDVHMNCLPWHELQAWRSDLDKSDWEESRRYVSGGQCKHVYLAGSKDGLVEKTIEVLSDWFVCAAPRPAVECVSMDDTETLSAADVGHQDVPSGFLTKDRYPETAAGDLLLARQLQRGDAAWEHDDSRETCPGLNCGKRFNYLNRRHHCRCRFFSFPFEWLILVQVLRLCDVQRMRACGAACWLSCERPLLRTMPTPRQCHWPSLTSLTLDVCVRA
jgi:TPR repeat protein